MSTRIKLQIIYWTLYFLFTFSVISSAARFYEVFSFDVNHFELFVTSPQKMLFNNSFFFVIFIHLKKYEFQNTEQILRNNRSFMHNIFLPGLINSSIFTIGLYSSFFISCSILKINFSLDNLFPFFMIFMFCFKINSIYFFIYVFFEKYIFSLFFILSENFVILIAYLGFTFLNINLQPFISLFLNPFYSILISLILSILSCLKILKKDYI